MKRDIEQDLILWKKSNDRYPLLVRGARQVGKSYLVESFGRGHFKKTIVVNFELQPRLKEVFKDLDPEKIISKINMLLGVRISPEDSLLFLDEIQDCPEAIVAMRYFREKMPGLAVIGAGSLLEFALNAADFKMPVGRVQFLYLKPLSFAEFLTATGNSELREFLVALPFSSTIDHALHDKLQELLRLYLVLGGMPAVLKEYLASKDHAACAFIQASLLQTFRSDFGKYARTSHHKYLQKVFDAAPRLIGARVKYSNIDAESKSRDIKNAVELLSMAGVVQRIRLSKASGLPLGADVSEKKFKLNFLDVGLMQNACGLQARINMEDDILQINAGAVAEQFVGQELLASTDSHQPPELYFWARDQKSSSAEVDYIGTVGARIVPIEVKSGSGGRLKSLQIFLKEKHADIGICLSRRGLSLEGNVIHVPLYMIDQIPRLVAAAA
jgi:hypothetical protein